MANPSRPKATSKPRGPGPLGLSAGPGVPPHCLRQEGAAPSASSKALVRVLGKVVHGDHRRRAAGGDQRPGARLHRRDVHLRGGAEDRWVKVSTEGARIPEWMKMSGPEQRQGNPGGTSVHGSKVLSLCRRLPTTPKKMRHQRESGKKCWGIRQARRGGRGWERGGEKVRMMVFMRGVRLFVLEDS